MNPTATPAVTAGQDSNPDAATTPPSARRRRLGRGRRLRPIRVAAIFSAGIAASVLLAASPAGADGINLAATAQIAGTNCDIEIGSYLNTPYAYPGTATEVYGCATSHAITVTTQLQDASMNGGSWYVWATTPTVSYPNTYQTRMLDYYWPSCPSGEWQWRVVAYVSIDHVFMGAYTNGAHSWTACS